MENKKKRVIVIVDSYSTGKNLPAAFRKAFEKYPEYADVELVHVQSQAEVPDVFKGQHADLIQQEVFIENIVNADLNKTIEILEEKYQVLHVLPGTECGVNVADELSTALCLESSNGTEKSEARRNKKAMHDTLRAADLAAINDCLSNDLEEIIRFANQQPNFVNKTEPVVLKPVDDAATNNVKFCYNEAEIREAFKLIMASKNTFGHQNDKVLAQEYLDGDEFIVNAVARRMPADASGNRELVVDFGDVWLEHKQLVKDADGKKSLVYGYEEYIFPTDPRHKKLTDYIRASSHALGVDNGPIHAEAKITTAKGVKLIEQAARIVGGINLEAYNEAFGCNPVDETVLAYLKPELFKEFANAPKEDKLQGKTIWNVFGISGISGIVKQQIDIDALKKALPTLAVINAKPAFHNNLSVGGELELTVNMLTDPYYFYLIGTQKEVERDYQKFRAMEPALLEMVVAPKLELAQSSFTTFAPVGGHPVPHFPLLKVGGSLTFNNASSD